MLCAKRSSLLCRGNNKQNTLEGFWHQHSGPCQKCILTLQNSYLFTLFPEVVSLLKCGIKHYSWVAAGQHWKYPRWQREEFSSLCNWEQRSKVFLIWWGIATIDKVSCPFAGRILLCPWTLVCSWRVHKGTGFPSSAHLADGDNSALLSLRGTIRINGLKDFVVLRDVWWGLWKNLGSVNWQQNNKSCPPV